MSLYEKIFFMKHVLNIISILLFAWIVGGGSESYIQVRPMTPSADLPVWGKESKSSTFAREAVETGAASLSERESQRNSRMESLLDTVRADPCNKGARKELAALISSYGHELKKTFMREDADAAYEHAVKVRLNDRANNIVREVMEDGYLAREDFPLMDRIIPGPLTPASGMVSVCQRMKAEEAQGADGNEADYEDNEEMHEDE